MKYFLHLMLCFFTVHAVSSQNDSLAVKNNNLNDTLQQESIWKTLKYDVSSMGNGFVHAYARPLYWKQRDYLIFGATTIGTAALFLSDEQTKTYFADQGTDIPETVKDFGYYFGKPVFNYGLTGSIYFYGLLTRNEKIRYTGVLMISSASVGGLLQQVLKTAAGRARPSTGLANDHFKPFSGSPEYSSFPSGHTVLSVTTAYAIAKQFKNPWVKTGIYLVGSITPLSRLWHGQHWASDVLLSTVMSVAIVESVDAYLKQQQRYHQNLQRTGLKRMSWSLKFGYSQLGVVGVF